MLGSVCGVPLRSDRRYSDVTIFIHDTKLHLHRFVICVRSCYIAKTFQDNMFAADCEGDTSDYTDDLKIVGL